MLIPKSSDSISIEIPSGSISLFLFIIFSADFISDLNIAGPFMSLSALTQWMSFVDEICSNFQLENS